MAVRSSKTAAGEGRGILRIIPGTYIGRTATGGVLEDVAAQWQQIGKEEGLSFKPLKGNIAFKFLNSPALDRIFMHRRYASSNGHGKAAKNPDDILRIALEDTDEFDTKWAKQPVALTAASIELVPKPSERRVLVGLSFRGSEGEHAQAHEIVKAEEMYFKEIFDPDNREYVYHERNAGSKGESKVKIMLGSISYAAAASSSAESFIKACAKIPIARCEFTNVHVYTPKR